MSFLGQALKPLHLLLQYYHQKGCSVIFNKFAFTSVRVLHAGHLDFSEEKPLEADLLLLTTEGNHFNFISTALQMAFPVVRTVKVLFSLGLFCIISKGHFSPWRGHLRPYNLRGSLPSPGASTQLPKADTHSSPLASQRELKGKDLARLVNSLPIFPQPSSKFLLGLKLKPGSTTQSECAIVFVLN